MKTDAKESEIKKNEVNSRMQVKYHLKIGTKNVETLRGKETKLVHGVTK